MKREGAERPTKVNARQIVHAGAPQCLSVVDPGAGRHIWRAVVRFGRLEPRDGLRHEQTVSMLAQVIGDSGGYGTRIVRVPVSVSSEDTRPARAWIAPVGGMLHVMVGTTKESLRCELVTFGVLPRIPDASWHALGAELLEACERTNPMAVAVLAAIGIAPRGALQ